MIKIAILSISLVFASSCSKKSQIQTSQDKPEAITLAASNLPMWVLDPTIEGKIAAVGISPKSKGGIKLQFAQAESDARANIASQIGVEVSRLTKDAMRKGQVDDVENVDQYFSQVTKEVIKDLPLSGAKRVNVFQSPQDGSLYVHMVLDATILQTYLKDHVDSYSAAMKKSGASREAINKTEDAMKSLFSELDSENMKKKVKEGSVSAN